MKYLCFNILLIQYRLIDILQNENSTESCDLEISLAFICPLEFNSMNLYQLSTHRTYSLPPFIRFAMQFPVLALDFIIYFTEDKDKTYY